MEYSDALWMPIKTEIGDPAYEDKTADHVWIGQSDEHENNYLNIAFGKSEAGVLQKRVLDMDVTLDEAEDLATIILWNVKEIRERNNV